MKLLKLCGIFLSFLILNLETFTKSSPIFDQTLNIATNVLDALCSKTLPFHNAINPQHVDISQMNLKYMTGCRNYSVPLKKAHKLMNIKGISRSKRFVFFAPGWKNTIENSDTIAEMADAFSCRDDVNFVAIDFGPYMATMYKWAAINTEAVGAAIAVGLAKLAKRIPISNIHLVGHSLGAHIMGAAGRSFKNYSNNRIIPRITGLDPAKPCFANEETLSSLGRSDAKLVDIIHSNNGVLGIRETVGDIDFYADGLTNQQPGCLDLSCSHSRALTYFAESAYPGNEKSFGSYKCANLQALERGNCAKSLSKVYMGFKLNTIKPGIFYVNVNKDSPYGKQSKELPNAQQNCKRQRQKQCKGR